MDFKYFASDHQWRDFYCRNARLVYWYRKFYYQKDQEQFICIWNIEIFECFFTTDINHLISNYVWMLIAGYNKSTFKSIWTVIKLRLSRDEQVRASNSFGKHEFTAGLSDASVAKSFVFCVGVGIFNELVMMTFRLLPHKR